MSNPKIKIFDVLNRIDENDYNYYQSLSDSEKKQVSLYMLVKWLACSDNKDKLVMLNSTMNKWFFKFYQYPELSYHILAACGTGKRDFYKWKKRKAPLSNRPITVDLLKEYYNDSTATAIEDSNIMNLESMIEIAERLGHIEIIDKLKKEYA